MPSGRAAARSLVMSAAIAGEHASRNAGNYEERAGAALEVPEGPLGRSRGMPSLDILPARIAPIQ